MADPPDTFTVQLSRSDRSVEVGAGQSILDALAGIVPVDWSCRRGECGSCVQRVVSGVPLHRDSVLSDRAKLANKRIAVCVSRSRTDVLVLDL